MKLNLGVGNHPLHGYKNLDLFYYPGTAEMHPDWGKPEDYDWEKGNFTDLSKFEDNSVDEVIIVHALEHTYWDGAIRTLNEIYRVLKPSGFVEVEVPDLDAVFDRKFDNKTMIGLVYGGWNDNTILLGHHCGFNRETLRQLMTETGFKDIWEIEVGFGTSRPEPDRNFRLKGIK